MDADETPSCLELLPRNLIDRDLGLVSGVTFDDGTRNKPLSACFPQLPEGGRF